MARWGYMLIAFLALAARAGAQGPARAEPLDAADQLRLLKANGTLIDNMVDHGVRLSNANTHVARATECRNAAWSLTNAAQQAAKKQEGERVAELTGLLLEVVRKGFLPTYDEGISAVTPESPAFKQLKELRGEVARDVNGLKTAIPTTGKVGENARVRNALKQLDELAETLK